jgi:hypothetical protein
MQSNHCSLIPNPVVFEDSMNLAQTRVQVGQ